MIRARLIAIVNLRWFLAPVPVSPFWLGLIAIAACLGHIWPVFFGFKGEVVLDILPESQQGAFTKEDGEKVVDEAGKRVKP